MLYYSISIIATGDGNHNEECNKPTSCFQYHSFNCNLLLKTCWHYHYGVLLTKKIRLRSHYHVALTLPQMNFPVWILFYSILEHPSRHANMENYWQCNDASIFLGGNNCGSDYCSTPLYIQFCEEIHSSIPRVLEKQLELSKRKFTSF